MDGRRGVTIEERSHMARETKNPSVEEILEAGRVRRKLPVACLGGTFWAYGLTRPEARAYREESVAAAGGSGEDSYADERYVMHSLRDADGNRVFREEHLTRLAAMNDADFRALLIPCLEINGIGEAGREWFRKNSGPIPSGDSGSASPPIGGSA
jgi:hypothetical protein